MFAPLLRSCAGLFKCGKRLTKRFGRQGGAVKQAQACLSARKELESSFHNCGRPVNLVQECICAGKT